MIKLYSKYQDKAGRKFLVVERFANIDYEAKTEVPNSIKLLDVNAGTTNMIPHNDFIGYTTDGRLQEVQQF